MIKKIIFLVLYTVLIQNTEAQTKKILFDAKDVNPQASIETNEGNIIIVGQENISKKRYPIELYDSLCPYLVILNKKLEPIYEYKNITVFGSYNSIIAINDTTFMICGTSGAGKIVHDKQGTVTIINQKGKILNSRRIEMDDFLSDFSKVTKWNDDAYMTAGYNLDRNNEVARTFILLFNYTLDTFFSASIPSSKFGYPTILNKTNKNQLFLTVFDDESDYFYLLQSGRCHGCCLLGADFASGS